MLCLIMRCADIFHPLRPFNLHMKWALAIAKEFTSQGNMEIARGFKSSAMMDPSTYVSSLGKSTADFIDFLVIPLYSCFVKVFPNPRTDNFIERLKATQKRWYSYDRMRQERTAAVINSPPLTSHFSNLMNQQPVKQRRPSAAAPKSQSLSPNPAALVKSNSAVENNKICSAGEQVKHRTIVLYQTF